MKPSTKALLETIGLTALTIVLAAVLYIMVSRLL